MEAKKCTIVFYWNIIIELFYIRNYHAVRERIKDSYFLLQIYIFYN